MQTTAYPQHAPTLSGGRQVVLAAVAAGSLALAVSGLVAVSRPAIDTGSTAGGRSAALDRALTAEAARLEAYANHLLRWERFAASYPVTQIPGADQPARGRQAEIDRLTELAASFATGVDEPRGIAHR